jgi:NADPH oxidase 2
MSYYERPSERSRWTPLTRMLLSGEMTQERQKALSSREKFDRWMINEGYRRVYVRRGTSEAFGLVPVETLDSS